MCAGNHMIGEAVQMIWQLRYKWQATSKIAVAHCGEIDVENQEFIRLVDPTVQIVDLCASSPVLGMSLDTARRRLRGFMCKVAAVVLSPFTETLLLDLDVVWFKHPENLFNSRIYTDSGALFFRDRVYPSSPQRVTDYNYLQKMFVDKGFPQDRESVQALASSNGFSFYWRYVHSLLPGEKPFQQVGELQDSSVVLIDRSRNELLLSTMAELLPNFDFGYGDKELFWVAATLARSNFTFEPFLAAQYADCYGVILHYDPDDVGNPSQASPLYVNAEYMVETDLTTVGEFLSTHMTPPVLVTADMQLAFTLDTWPEGKHRGDEGCTCQSFGCIPVPPDVNTHMLYAEWVTLSKRLAREGPSEDCVRVYLDSRDTANEAFTQFVRPQDCFVVGCPQLPIAVDLTLPWVGDSAQRGLTCDPVHFAPIAPAKMAEIAAAARRPDSTYNQHKDLPDGTPVQCNFDRQLYWYKNGTLYPFANWNAFVTKGLDLDNVVRLTQKEFDKFPRSSKEVV
jgi:hypothetical protein